MWHPTTPVLPAVSDGRAVYRCVPTVGVFGEPPGVPPSNLVLIVSTPTRRRPIVVWVLMTGIVAAFGYAYWLQAGSAVRAQDLVLRFGVVSSELRSGFGRGTVLTHVFLHAGVPHMLANVYFLYVFGDAVEDELGHARFTALFVLSAAGGALAYAAAERGSLRPMIGASGAISGILGAYAVAFPRAKLGVVLFFRRFQVPVFASLAVWTALQVLLFAFRVPGVAWAAHVGGLATGTLFALVFGRNAARSGASAPIRRAFRAALLAIAAVLVALGAFAGSRRVLNRFGRGLDAACEARDFVACNNLGTLFERGDGRPRDLRRATQLYARACDGNDALGCANLGALLFNGRGDARDLRRAVALFERSCAAGNAYGCTNLGVALQQGRGTVANPARAIPLLARACDGGSAVACNDLGSAYENGSGVAQNYGTAVRLHQRACTAGDLMGCANLGVAYFTGHGVTQDRAAGVALFRRACEGDVLLGCYNLGVALGTGEGVSQDVAEALRLYVRACDGGQLAGCVNAGDLHESGRATPQDYEQAAHYYARACDGGHAHGCLALGTLFEGGRGVVRDANRAAVLYGQACDAGDAHGCEFLADMVNTGSGVARDPARAAELWSRACSGGRTSACARATR